MRRARAMGRYEVKGPGRDPHLVPSLGAGIAVALDWASRLKEEGSVIVRELGSDRVVVVARGTGNGCSFVKGAVA